MLTTHRDVKTKYDIIWEEKYNILCQYKEEYGNCDVPCDFIYKGIKLGKWVSTQRQTFKGKGRGRLTQDRINKLNSIGFIWDIFDYQWNYNYSLLCEFKEVNGRFPKAREEYKGVKLGKWVCTQRQVYKGNKIGNLFQSQIDKLNSIGIELDK